MKKNVFQMSKSVLLIRRALLLLSLLACSLFVNAGKSWTARYQVNIDATGSTGSGTVYLSADETFANATTNSTMDKVAAISTSSAFSPTSLTASMNLDREMDIPNGDNQKTARNTKCQHKNIRLRAEASPGSTFQGWKNGMANNSVITSDITIQCDKDVKDGSIYTMPNSIVTYYPIFTANTYHFISPSIRAVYQGESGIETGGGTVALVRDGTPESRPADESGDWQTQITGSLISAQGNGVDDGIVYEYSYHAKPADGYVFLGWHTLNGTTLTQLSGEQDYLPAEGTTATSTDVNNPTRGPVMVALFKKSTTYWHTGVSVAIAGYEDERAEKGWVYADDGTLGTVEAVESARKWVTELHDETAHSQVDDIDYTYTYYAKSSDPTKYAFKGWAKTPFGAVDYEGSETNRVLKDYVFTMTDDNTSEINAYPTPTLYAVFESFFYRCPPVAVADNSRGGGWVYVSLASASEDNCTEEEISAGEELQQVAATGTSHKYTVYYYAKKENGAEFVGWSTTPDGLNILPNSIGKAEYSTTYESQNKSKNAPHVAAPLYAVFKHDFDIRQQDRMIVYDDEDGNKSINDAKVLIDFQKGNTLTATLSGADASYFTLSNRSGSKIGNSITFDATQGLIEMVVAYQGDLAEAVSKKAEITLSATYGSYTEPVTRDVTITVEEAPMITFLPTDGKGSYTIKMTNGSGINYTMSAGTQEDIKVQVTHESMSNLEMNISDLSGDEYRFFGWQMIDGTTTTYISYDDLVNYQFTKSVKVRPEFIHNSRATYSIVGDETNTPYHDFALVMKDAGELAESMGVSQTVLLNDSWKGTTIKEGVLPKGNYTIPSGVNLLIPGDTEHTYRTNLTRDAGDFLNQSGLKSAEHIRWIVEEGTNITVQENANILVYSRIITYGNDDNGRPYQYGHIELKENCKLNFLSGSNLYVYGYITGPLTSEITMNSGTTVKEVFQVKDWRGGTATSQIVLFGRGYKVFLIGQYYVQNIEVPLIIKKGASEVLEGGISDLADMDVNFVVSNTDAGLFRMGEGTWIKKYYDPYTDRLCFIGSKDEGATGEMHLNYVSIDAGIATVSSANYILPIPSNFDVKIQGNLTGVLLNDVAFMPGSTLTVEKGSTLKVEKRLFAYDDIYKTIGGKGYYGAGNKVLAPLTYRPGETGKEFKYKRTEADLVDAKFIIDGELICDGGEIYTTNATTQTTNHANITSNGGGKVTFGSLSGYDTKVYQIYQDGTSPSYKEVPVSPARLRHGNGSYETNPQQGTYTYVNNRWTLNASTTPNPTIPAVVDYIPRFTVSEVPEASTYVGKSTPITVSASANNTNIPAEDWANATKMTWEYELIGTDANQFSLSGNQGAGTITFEPKSEGRKTVTLRITATYTKNVNASNTAVKYTYSKDVQLTGNASYLAPNTLKFADLDNVYFQSGSTKNYSFFDKEVELVNTEPISITWIPTDIIHGGGTTIDAIFRTLKKGEVTITATQEPDLENNVAGITISKKIKVTDRVLWNWDVLYFGTVNKDPITVLDGSPGWKLEKTSDDYNIINFQGENPADYTATIEDQIAGKYTGIKFTFTQNKQSQEFESHVITNPQHLRVDVNNDTVYRAVTLSANENVTFNNDQIEFSSTAQAISQWKMTFVGVPDKLHFIPRGTNTWQVEESANGVNWTTSFPWKNITSNTDFELSLLPSTRYLRISYGAGNVNPDTKVNKSILREFYITELADVKADVEKLYMPVEEILPATDPKKYKSVTKEVVLTYANTGKLNIGTTPSGVFQLKNSNTTSDEPSEVLVIPATTETTPYGITGVEVISSADEEIQGFLNVYEGSNLVLQIPISTYLFPQKLPIKLATDKPDGGDRYYFVTTHTHNAEWDGTDGVRKVTLNNAVSDAAPYLTFAYDGAPTYIGFDFTPNVHGTWELEQFVEGEWKAVSPDSKDVVDIASGKFKRFVSSQATQLRVIYQSDYAEKVEITELVIVGDASVIVDPARMVLDVETPEDLTVTAINLPSMTITSNNEHFKISYNSGEYLTEYSLTSAECLQLGDGKMGDIDFQVQWYGTDAVEVGELRITTTINDEVKTLGTVELTGIQGKITNGDIKMNTGVPEGYTLASVEDEENEGWKGDNHRPVNISAAFSPEGEPLFDYVVIYGETTTSDGSSTITLPNKLSGSNAKTPCYIYKKGNNGYEFLKRMENVNVKDKTWDMGVDDKDAVTIPAEQNSVSMYITGFAPYASTGYTKADEGVWYFRANGGQSIDIYLEDCYIYSRSKTNDGHTFADRSDGYSFVETYACGSGAVLVFACNDQANETPMNVTIHTLDRNLLKSNYGCFMQSIAGRGFQASSPVQIRVINDQYVRASRTTLNFTDEWPASQDARTGTDKRTNGFLSLQKQVNNAPSIDMGAPHTIVNFNGGQVELQNAQIVSTNYASSLAICHRSGKFAGVPLAYGMGTDAVEGTVNFNDGTTTVRDMWVVSTYAESYLLDKDQNGDYITKVEKGKTYYLTSCLRTPANTFVYGGSHCMMRACTDPTTSGGAPRNKPESEGGVLLGLYKYPKLDPNPVDAENETYNWGWEEIADGNGLVRPNRVPDGYGISSVTPNDNGTPTNYDDDFLNFWFDPTFEKSVQPEVEKTVSFWKTCMTEISAVYAGYGGTVGGDATIMMNGADQLEIVKNLMYCQIDEQIRQVISSPNYYAPVKNPAPEGENYLPVHPSRVGEQIAHYVTNVNPFQVEDRVYYITTATADVWNAFTAPFDVANIYIMETYPESELEAMEGTVVDDVTMGRTQIIQEQAKHNADFAAFFAVTVALGQQKDFETIYSEYMAWADMKDKELGLNSKQGYERRGKRKLIPFDGSNWAEADFYLNENTADWTYTGEEGKEFTTYWTPADASDGKLMEQGKTYAMLLPFCMGCGEDINTRTFWDYWSGKFLIFESTSGSPHIIDGSAAMTEIVDNIPSMDSYTAKLTGNSTFSHLTTQNQNIYNYVGNLQHSTFKYSSALTPVQPTQSFLLANIPVPEGVQVDGVTRSGKIIYGPSGNGNNPGTGVHTPTVGGDNSLFITAINGGINIAVAYPQHVRVLSATGAVLYSGMVQTAVDVNLPTDGIYIVSGEKEVQKILY